MNWYRCACPSIWGPQMESRLKDWYMLTLSLASEWNRITDRISTSRSRLEKVANRLWLSASEWSHGLEQHCERRLDFKAGTGEDHKQSLGGWGNSKHPRCRRQRILKQRISKAGLTYSQQSQAHDTGLGYLVEGGGLVWLLVEGWKVVSGRLWTSWKSWKSKTAKSHFGPFFPPNHREQTALVILVLPVSRKMKPEVMVIVCFLQQDVWV